MSETDSEENEKVIEHRREGRVQVTIPATLIVDNQTWTCVVLNLSSGGLLLSLDQRTGLKLPEASLGKMASVILGSERESRRSLHGRIVRVLLDSGNAVAALSIVRNG